MDDFVFLTNLCPFLQLPEPLRPNYAFQSTVLVLSRLQNHFSSSFIELQCPKWKIGLKIGDFVILTFILPKIFPFLQLSVPLRPNYAFQSTVLVLSRLKNHFSSSFIELQCPKWKIGLKIGDFVILTFIHFTQLFPLFATFKAPTTYLCLPKYSFGIVMVAQPFFQTICGFTVFQMENWPQN